MDLKNILNFEASNGAIESLKELIKLAALPVEDIAKFVEIRGNVQNGQQLGWVGTIGNVGWSGGGCDPEYHKPDVKGLTKKWDMGEWSMPFELCYSDFENTIAEYALNHGTNVGDLTSTEIVSEILVPLIAQALSKMYWRIVWFGDKDAKNVADSGVITDGVDVSLFNMTDGLFKQLFAIAAANAQQKTAIDANSQTTRALQFSKLRQEGVATGIVDDMIMNANPALSTIPDAGIYMTKSLADALAMDVRKIYKVIMPWEEVFAGVKMSEYNGVKIYRCDMWDEVIQNLQNNGTKLNLPHRAVYAAPSLLLAASPAANFVSDLDIFFDQKSRTTNIYAGGKIGALVGQDDLFQVAY